MELAVDNLVRKWNELTKKDLEAWKVSKVLPKERKP